MHKSQKQRWKQNTYLLRQFSHQHHNEKEMKLIFHHTVQYSSMKFCTVWQQHQKFNQCNIINVVLHYHSITALLVIIYINSYNISILLNNELFSCNCLWYMKTNEEWQVYNDDTSQTVTMTEHSKSTITTSLVALPTLTRWQHKRRSSAPQQECHYTSTNHKSVLTPYQSQATYNVRYVGYMCYWYETSVNPWPWLLTFVPKKQYCHLHVRQRISRTETFYEPLSALMDPNRMEIWMEGQHYSIVQPQRGRAI